MEMLMLTQDSKLDNGKWELQEISYRHLLLR
jgi:hypothetical protein